MKSAVKPFAQAFTLAIEGLGADNPDLLEPDVKGFLLDPIRERLHTSIIRQSNASVQKKAGTEAGLSIRY
jgi:hypothetical protein